MICAYIPSYKFHCVNMIPWLLITLVISIPIFSISRGGSEIGNDYLGNELVMHEQIYTSI